MWEREGKGLRWKAWGRWVGDIWINACVERGWRGHSVRLEAEEWEVMLSIHPLSRRKLQRRERFSAGDTLKGQLMVTPP